MRIGNLSEVSGTPVETIRFYEREGLLPAAQRTANNYRLYTAEHADRLAFRSIASAPQWKAVRSCCRPSGSTVMLAKATGYAPVR